MPAGDPNETAEHVMARAAGCLVCAAAITLILIGAALYQLVRWLT